MCWSELVKHRHYLNGENVSKEKMGGKKKATLLWFEPATINYGVHTQTIKPVGHNSLKYLEVPYEPIVSYKN